MHELRTVVPILALWLAACLGGIGGSTSKSFAADAEFVSSEACASCHEAESKAWSQSHHAHAMLETSDDSVLAPFAGETFVHDGVSSTFFKKDGKFLVNTDGPEGTMGDFEVAYTFGITPLQQYLIKMPAGRYQALGIAWDSRPAQEGGQKWFHLYPDQKLKAGNPLHWTGIDQNWNYQCAWCHSTDLRKNYDAAGDSFSTSWSEINVGCEACHGPGSNHVAWANMPESERDPADKAAGFPLRFDERRGVSWSIGEKGSAVRSAPMTTAKEINACAGCHARRGQFADDPVAALNFHDAFRASLLEPGLYYPDGQQRDEVYKYGSFLQSKMHDKGVVCSDCHDPHSGKVVAEGNAVCGQCHAPEVFDAAAHHHHEAGSSGSECAACHMPTTNYMIVDARHDHSMRIPRPDRNAITGAPDACTMCHTDRDADWAAAAIREWYPEPKTGFQDFAELFAEIDGGAPGSRESLVGYLGQERPAIVTASALARLVANPTPAVLRKAAELLKSPEPLVRSTAVRIAQQANVGTRLLLLGPLLSDPVRLVRMDAANALAGEAESAMDAATRTKFDSALEEYVASLEFNADRPEANANLGNLYLARGDLAGAATSFERARERDPTFLPAIVGLADTLRRQGNEAAAEQELRQALADNPDAAELAHALGLSLVRKGATAEALEWLQKAARLGPENPRYGYVYAVALHDTGRPDLAITALKTVLARHPYDRSTLSALVSYHGERGEFSEALKAAETLAALEPDNPQIRAMLGAVRQQTK